MTKEDKQCLIVKSVDPKQKFQHPPVKFKHLPQHEFSLMMVAPPGSGKTNLLCWMILKLYKAYFHRIVVCSTTLDNDEKWNYVMKQKGILARNKKLEQIMDGMAKNKNNKKWKVVFRDDDDLKKNKQGEDDQFDGTLDKEDMFMDIAKIYPILAEQQQTIEFLKEYLKQEKKDEDQAKYLADRMLIVLDDQAGRFDAGTNTPLNNFVIRHRHYSASVIIVTQAYKAIPRTIRTCMMQVVLFDIGSMQELKLIYEDRADCLDEKSWMQVYRHAVKDKPFSFLYFNYKFPPGQRFYKRFETMINTSCLEKEEDVRISSADDSKCGFSAKPKKSNPDENEQTPAKRRRISPAERDGPAKTG